MCFHFDGRVDLLLMLEIGGLAFCAGHRVFERRLPGGVPLRDGLGLPLLHGEVIDQHGAQGHDEQSGDDRRIGRVRPMDLVEPILDKRRFILAGNAFFGVGDIVLLNGVDRVARRLLIHASGPNHGHEDHQRHQYAMQSVPLEVEFLRRIS